MELNQEINQLLFCCKDKEYIKSNIESLKTYFTIPQNVNILRFVLTTNKNITALKIIEKLQLKVIPYIHINTFTYISIFWLYRMELLIKEEYDQLAKKFQILKNFDLLEEETETTFLRLQIDKRRKVQSRNGNFMPPAKVDCFADDNRMTTFIFNLDDLFDIKKYIEPFQDIKNAIFNTELKTFEEFPGDASRTVKEKKFKEIKGKLVNCPVRNFTSFFSLDIEVQRKLESLMNALSKVRRCGFKYYICSEEPLANTLTFCYLFINSIDLTKIIETKDEKLNIVGKTIIFGQNSKTNRNFKYEFIDDVVNNLTKFMKDYSS